MCVVRGEEGVMGGEKGVFLRGEQVFLIGVTGGGRLGWGREAEVVDRVFGEFSESLAK